MENKLTQEEELQYKKDVILDCLIKYGSLIERGFSKVSRKEIATLFRQAAAYIEIHELINTK